MKYTPPPYTRIPGPYLVLCAGTQNKTSLPHLDAVFYALGNYNRRKLFEILCHNEHQISDLMEITGGDYQAIRTHLITLEAYGLITSFKDGKERLHHANLNALQNLVIWSNMMAELLHNLN